MNGVRRLLILALSGKSETLNGYTAGISLLSLSMVISAVPVSKLPPVPFLQLLLSNYLLLVVSAIAAGCMLVSKSTVRFASGRSFPMVLFSLLSLAAGIMTYVSGMFIGGAFSSAVGSSPVNPADMLALSLILTSAFMMSLAAKEAFTGKASSEIAARTEQRS